MKCQKCQLNDATFHYQTMLNGKIAVLHLCQDCARELGYEAILPSAVFDPFGSMLGDFFSPWRSVTETKSPVCPFCGATQKTIADTGKAGCAQCYGAFPVLFDPLIRRIHGEAAHNGKTPSSAGEQVRNRRMLEQLRAEQKTAVAQQKYEEAAVLRDRIKALEAGGAPNE